MIDVKIGTAEYRDKEYPIVCGCIARWDDVANPRTLDEGNITKSTVNRDWRCPECEFYPWIDVS